MFFYQGRAGNTCVGSDERKAMFVSKWVCYNQILKEKKEAWSRCIHCNPRILEVKEGSSGSRPAWTGKSPVSNKKKRCGGNGEQYEFLLPTKQIITVNRVLRIGTSCAPGTIYQNEPKSLVGQTMLWGDFVLSVSYLLTKPCVLTHACSQN